MRTFPLQGNPVLRVGGEHSMLTGLDHTAVSVWLTFVSREGFHLRCLVSAVCSVAVTPASELYWLFVT